jgi:uncharacterized OB-fold protein
MGKKAEKKQVPLSPGIFSIPDNPGEKPHLIASRCRECGKYFFPQRVICLNCGAEALVEASLSGRGKLYSYTIARQQLPGALVEVPYAIAIISMEEGCQVYSPVTENWESLAVDMEMEVYFEKVSEDQDGNDQLAYKFRAVKG